ncbi:MAG: YybS family protein [Desulfobacterales bacterium]|nr:YybS family protein [Desulfobacterales bacterium]
MINTARHPALIKDVILGISLCMSIFASVLVFPVSGMFTLLFLPLPVLFYRLKLGRNPGLLIAVVSFSALVIMTRGFAFDVLYFGALLATGLFLGECIERHLSVERIMIYTCLGVLGTALGAFVLYAGIQGRSMGDIVNDYVANYLAMTAKLYADMGLAQEQIQTLNSAFLAVLPGMFISSFMTTVWMNILIIKKLLMRVGIQLKSISNLNRFRVPDYMVWPVIGLGLALFTPASMPKYIAINCLIVFTLVYFFQGIAVVSFYFQKKNASPVLRIFAYGLIAVQIYVLILVIGLGFFDTWIDFRKLAQRK